LKVLRDLAASFSYFSILPIAHSDAPPNDEAVAYLPVVGALIGAISGAVAYGIFLLTHGQLAAAITAWILSIALSGAIHVDGFLDCCDGLLAMATPQRRLEIMRDPHHGTYAIAGMVMISVLWLYALVHVPAALLPAVLTITGLVSRALALSLWPANRVPKIVYAVIGLIVAFGVVALFGSFARRRLGGVLSGDCYGAAIVLAEIALLMISAVSTSLGPGLLR